MQNLNFKAVEMLLYKYGSRLKRSIAALFEIPLADACNLLDM